MTRLNSTGKNFRRLCIGGGIVCLVVAAYFRHYFSLMRCEKTTGVVELIYKDRDDGGRWATWVRVSYTRHLGTNNWEVYEDVRLGQFLSKPNVGDSVALLSDPESRSVLPVSGIWVIYPVCAVIGGLFIMAGLFAPRFSCFKADVNGSFE